ncbi:MAG: fumarylacetoacetate hydrolase family protein, partial [Hungatella sp.]
MKILTYEVDHKEKVGILSRDGEWVYSLQAIGMDYATMQEAIEGISESEIQLLEHSAKLDPYSLSGSAKLEEVKILAPILYPRQDIICLGLNYMEHAKESAEYARETFGGEHPDAVYFSKRVNRTVSNGEGIPAHADLVDSLDYEVELAVIIGKDASHVSPEDARSYVFGYTIMNDVSARTIQRKHQQWYFGKSLDGFVPMGPYIVTADTLPYPPKLKIQSRVNGELRQDSNTESLIFGIDHVISELSRGM